MNPTTALLVAAKLSDERKTSQRFRDRLIAEGRRRRDKRIPRIALQSPTMSAWRTLFGSGSEQAMISMTGFDHHAFRHVLEAFSPLYDRLTPYSESGFIKRKSQSGVGRKRTISSCDCLGLALAWYRTRGSVTILCMLFGITHSVCVMFIRFARRLLIKVLSKDDSARVKMPSNEEIELFKGKIREKYSMLDDVYAVADGLKLQLEQSGDTVIQEMFYNGWTHDHYVGNVFVFGPNGMVIACVINAPGNMHDSCIAEWGSLYERLEEAFDRTGGRVVVDSAFSRGNYPFLIKSAQDEQGASTALENVQLRQATSVRQASEWGMRGFQGSFPRIKDRFIYEERGERKLMLWCTVLLFNLRTKLVGLNQILSTYMPHLGAEANLFLRNELGL